MNGEARYTENDRKVIDKYWECIRYTGRTGTVADGIVRREEAYWDRFSTEVVIRALKIHMEKYSNLREHYTRGIMRNLAAESEGCHESNRKNVVRGEKKPHGHRERNVRAADAFRANLRL